jgi:hypothetical protein
MPLGRIFAPGVELRFRLPAKAFKLPGQNPIARSIRWKYDRNLARFHCFFFLGVSRAARCDAASASNVISAGALFSFRSEIRGKCLGWRDMSNGGALGRRPAGAP